MLRIKTNVYDDSSDYSDLYKRYTEGLKEYKIDLVDEDDDRYNKYISTCIVIPFLEINLIVQVHAIDDSGQIKYYLLGYLKSHDFSDEHITLVHASIGWDRIYNYEKLYEALDGNYKSFNREEWMMNLEMINKVCNAVLHRYLCNRGRWRNDYAIDEDGDAMDIDDYLLYIEF